MWIFAVAFIGLMLYFIWQLPPQWRDLKHPDYALWSFGLVGFVSLMVLITCFYRIPNGWFRQTVLYTESAFFCLLIFTLTVCLFRQLTYYPLQHLAVKHSKLHWLVRLFASKRLFINVVLVFTVLYCAVGFYQMEQLVVTPYTLTIAKVCTDDTVRVALLADLHVGAGASDTQLNRMTEAVNAMEADVIVLAGDLADSASSLNDLEILSTALAKMKSTYGMYYAEGNHEAQCHFNVLPWLEQAGVTVLHNEAITLPNGLVILGRCDRRDVNVSAIRTVSGISKDAPCIVIQHRPQGVRKIAGMADVVLSGHTHGYQLPMCAFYFPLLFDLVEGTKAFADTQLVTTAGVAAWGYHCKWPSKCEAVQLDLVFTGGRHEA